MRFFFLNGACIHTKSPDAVSSTLGEVLFYPLQSMREHSVRAVILCLLLIPFVALLLFGDSVSEPNWYAGTSRVPDNIPRQRAQTHTTTTPLFDRECDRSQTARICDAVSMGEPFAPRIVGVSKHSPLVYNPATWVTVRGKKRNPVAYVPPFQLDIHSPAEDVFISKTLAEGLIWDEGMWDAFQGAFLVNTDLKRTLVVDVGANIGLFVMLSAAMGMRVIAVEPLWKNVDRMVRSVRQNEFDSQVEIYHNALSYTYNTVSVVAASQDNQGSAHMGPPVRADGIYGVDYVESIRLDDIVHEDVKVLKLDVESFEGHVMNGALSVLCNHVIEFVFMKVHSFRSRTDCSYTALVDFMLFLGYSLHHLVPPPHVLGPSLRAEDVTMQDVIFRKIDPTKSPRDTLAPSVCAYVKGCM
jgi:FkbM family methyltransferase